MKTGLLCTKTEICGSQFDQSTYQSTEYRQFSIRSSSTTSHLSRKCVAWRPANPYYIETGETLKPTTDGNAMGLGGLLAELPKIRFVGEPLEILHHFHSVTDAAWTSSGLL